MNNNFINVDEQLYKKLEQEFIERDKVRKYKEERDKANREFKNSLEFNNRSYDILLQRSI